ncbi:ABC transporter ATP-binding protein [Streptacidiphilus cavernicola]|uniref:ABC transporter ATP-binding protein n=1 Tax=Streptacidiphilus cavernicola TaxID=3342716 RepID=A0ABV6VSI3_9ACTN
MNPTDRAVLVHADGLTKLHRRRGGEPVHAVRGVDFRIVSGETYGFLGPNGAGKSTTMRMICCVSEASGGTLRVLGLDPATDGSRIRSRIGVVPQDDTLDRELTVRENLLVYGRYFGMSRAARAARADELLAFARLEEKAGTRVDTLSGGMRRRLTIARSLVNSPEILILDEPTTGLDPQARHLLWERLHQLKEQGVTLILTTHYMDEAEQLCDRLAVMDQGRIVAESTPAALIAEHAGREVLELRFDRQDRATALDKVRTLTGSGAADRVEELPDRVLVYGPDADAAQEQVQALGLSPTATLVRRAGLEDVFLRLTGRTLVD